MADVIANHTSAFPSTLTATPSVPSPSSEATVGIYASIVILIMLFVIIGNLIVLLVLYRQRKQNAVKVANMFLANLAVVDLAVGIVLFPFSVVTIIAGDWVFGQDICEVNGFLNMTAGTASILTMAVISVDRYRAIVYPPGHKLRAQQAWFLLSAVWLWSILIGILPVLGWNEYLHHSEFSSLCKFSFTEDRGYVLLSVVTCFVIPLVVMFYCYVRVFLKVRHHRKQLQIWQSREPRNMKFEAKTAKIVFTVLFLFAVLWTPFVIVTIVQASSVLVPRELFILFSLTAGAHSAGNPVIYVTMNRKFRGDLFDMIPCLDKTAGCCLISCRLAPTQVRPSQAEDTGADCVVIDRMEMISAEIMKY